MELLSVKNLMPGNIMTITGIDGLETFAIDAHTIGVRPKWISVKDKLPKADEHVLVVNKDEGVFRAYRDNHDKYPSWHCYPIGSYASDGCVFGITHWMPLPEPPKENRIGMD